MTPEEVRGRRLTLAIAVWLGIVPTVLSLLATALSRRPTTGAVWTSALFSATVNVVLFWFLYKAYRWTRIYIAASVFLFTLLSTVRVLSLARHFTTAAQLGAVVFILLPRLLNLFIAGVLWRSTSITAYFDRENETPTLNLSA